jgi:hypothetical protein
MGKAKVIFYSFPFLFLKLLKFQNLYYTKQKTLPIIDRVIYFRNTLLLYPPPPGEPEGAFYSTISISSTKWVAPA